MERKLPHPGFWMAVLLVVIVFAVQIVLGVPLGLVDVAWERVLHRPSPQLERQPLLIGCINIVACGAAIAFGLYLNRLSFRRAFVLDRVPLRRVIAVAIAMIGASILLSEADNVVGMLLPPPEWLLSLFRDLFMAQGKLLSRIFLLVIVAPLTEELLFRGLILRGLLSRYRPAVAVTLTAFLFGVLHANPWQFVSAMFLGLVFGWFYLRTGSVPVCILGHAIANGLTIVSSFIPWDIPGLTGTPDYSVPTFQPWWLDIIGLALLAAGLFLFSKTSPPIAPATVAPAAPPIIEPPS